MKTHVDFFLVCSTKNCFLKIPDVTNWKYSLPMPVGFEKWYWAELCVQRKKRDVKGEKCTVAGLWGMADERSKSYRNESFTRARMMTPNSLMLQKVKAAAKWSFVQTGTALGTRLPGTVPQLTRQHLMLSLLLAHSCLTYPHSERFWGQSVVSLAKTHSVKSFLTLRHYLGMEFEAIIWSALDMPRRICSFYKRTQVLNVKLFFR